MKLLKSFDKGNNYYDTDADTFCIMGYNEKNIGWFKVVGEEISAIYFENNQLFFKLGDYNINIYDIVECFFVNIDNDKAIFTLYDKDEFKLNFCYEYKKDFSTLDPFDYIDDEDYNWGAFICNIVNSKERVQNIIQSRSV